MSHGNHRNGNNQRRESRKQRGGIGLFAIGLGALCWLALVWQLLSTPAYERPETTTIFTLVFVGLGFMIGGTVWLWLWRTNADRKIDDLSAAVHNLSAVVLGLFAGSIRTRRSVEDLADMARLTGAHHQATRQQRRRQIHAAQDQLRYGAASGRREHTRPTVVVVNDNPARSSRAPTGPLPAHRGLPAAGGSSAVTVSMAALCTALHAVYRTVFTAKDLSWRANTAANPDGKALFIDNNAINVVVGRLDLLKLDLIIGTETVSCRSCFEQSKQARTIVMRALRREITANGAAGAYWCDGVAQGWSRKLESELLQLNQP